MSSHPTPSLVAGRVKMRLSKAAALLAVFVLLVTASNAFAATQPDSASSLLGPGIPRSDEPPERIVLGRHGDEEHEEESSGHTDHMIAVGPPIATSSPAESSIHDHDSHSQLQGAHEHTSGHQDSQHADSHAHSHVHSHEEAPEPSIPSFEQLQLAPMVIPFFPKAHGGGGHSHAHSGPILDVFNETTQLLAKGPEPLSYIEWDFAYGLGHVEELRRFTSQSFFSADQDNATGVMGYSGGRFRTLLDEPDFEARKQILQDLKDRVGTKSAPIEPSRHKWFMLLHLATWVSSCFFLLPLALFLRAAKSSLFPLASLGYLASLTGSLLVLSMYKALSPKLYPDNAHGSMAWMLLWISAACLSGDLLRLTRQILGAVRGVSSSDHATGQSKLSAVFQAVVRGTSTSSHQERTEKYSALEEEQMLEHAVQDEDVESVTPGRRQSASPTRVHFASSSSQETLNEPSHWSAYRSGDVSPTSTLNNSSRHGSLSEAIMANFSSKTARHWSGSDDRALRTSAGSASQPSFPRQKRSLATTLSNILRYTHVVVTRSLPIYAFAVSYVGLAVYTGSCRATFKNTCLAHGIKGGIFFWYGLLTFARYLGAYADCGWAWNRRPSHETAKSRGAGWKVNVPSAEWTECFVILTYGATNTWMERFGAQPGDPYTVKQVQHISIAVMYWFGGSLGVLLETRSVRDLLSFPIALDHPSAASLSESRAGPRRSQSSVAGSTDQECIVSAQTAPPSYAGSFNPFPALCIGITGIAMAAHHQDYAYEVAIHALWGQLLAGFAILRCITYFFLWLRPPMSILPSRPPTEALASFSLASGGLVFMLSSEEVSFAAMRNGFDDFMAILCITVAIICFVFALVAALFLIKAWAVRREMRLDSRRMSIAAAADRGPAAQQQTLGSAAATSVEHSDNEPVFVLGEEEEGESARLMDISDAAHPRRTTSPKSIV